jgi:hypothetical protein
LGNNFVRDRDPNGQFTGPDDEVVMGIGFVVGFVEEAISTHWNFKNGNLIRDLLSGVITAEEAEVGYLTLGGGLSDLAADPAVNALTSYGLPYAASFAASSAYTYATNSKTISDASPDMQVALLAGFNATSAITAGFNSNYMQTGFSGIGNSTIWNGATSQGIGGFISNAGNSLITNGGHWDKNTTFAAVVGFGSSFAGQVAHNAVDKLPFMHNFGKTPTGHFGEPFVQNIASGVVQQWVGNMANEIGARNNYDVGDPNADAYITSRYGWWASYINGLGGYDADLFNPYSVD